MSIKGKQLVASVLLLFVCALLSYTFMHTGAVLAKHIDPWWLGYVAAFGIEGLIIMLSWMRGYKHVTQSAFGWTLVIVLSISAVANLFEGYAVKYGTELSVENISTLDPIQALVWVLVTLVVPFLVFIAGDLVGSVPNGVKTHSGANTRHSGQVSQPLIPQKFEIKELPAQTKSTTTQVCEHCGKQLGPSRQALAAHLRFCKPYKEAQDGRL